MMAAVTNLALFCMNYTSCGLRKLELLSLMVTLVSIWLLWLVLNAFVVKSLLHWMLTYKTHPKKFLNSLRLWKQGMMWSIPIVKDAKISGGDFFCLNHIIKYEV